MSKSQLKRIAAMDDPKIIEGEKFAACRDKYIDEVERGTDNNWIYELDQEEAQECVMKIYKILMHEDYVTVSKALNCLEAKSEIEKLILEAADKYAERHYNDPEDQFEFDDDC